MRWNLPWWLLLAGALAFAGCPEDDDDADDDDASGDDDTGDDDSTGDDDTGPVDADGDGWDEGVDCDDSDPALNWDDVDGDGASTCDGDCDDADPALNLDDLDGDGYSPCDGDCQPADPRVFPEVTATSGWQRSCEVWLEADITDSDWRSHRVEQAHWVYDGTMLAMYFRTGYEQDEMVFGVYYTTNWGQTWSMDGPIFGGAGSPDVYWDGEGISNPSVVYDPSAPAPYKLYYSALASQIDGNRHVGVAVSQDGFSWVRYADPAPPNAAVQLLSPGPPGAFDEEIINTPYVYLDGATYVMLYVCRNPVTSGICMATSGDGYSFDKWDPAPGAGDDPQPLFVRGDVGDWDEDSVGYPIPLSDGVTTSLLHSGRAAGGIRATGAVHLPFGPSTAEKLAPLSPVFERSFQPGRWDAEDMYPNDTIYDGGSFQLFYTGSYEDYAFPGDQVAQIGHAANDQPTVVLTAPAVDPHAMQTGDPVTLEGTVTDTGPLDTLLVVISSSVDPSLQLTATPDPAGAWSVTAPPNTFVPGIYVLSVTAYDEGGVGHSTSITFDVS